MRNRFLFYWLPLIIWITGIFVVSSLPNHYFPHPSKIPLQYPLHLIAFFILFLLFYRLFDSKRIRNLLLLSLFITMIISISKECWQIFIPGRAFSLKDILLDGGAALLGMIVISLSRTTRLY